MAGSSPRARGTGVQAREEIRGYWFIPACAGNSSSHASYAGCSAVHPRVRGEQSAIDVGSGVVAGSSPRARGTERVMAYRLGDVRFIPACAGNR